MILICDVCVCDINTYFKNERKKSKEESLWSDDHLSAMNTPGAQSLAGKFHLLQKGKTVLLEGVASGWCISRTASQHGSSYTAQWPCVPRMRKPGRVQWQSRLRFVSVSSVWSGREVTMLRWRKSSPERMTAWPMGRLCARGVVTEVVRVWKVCKRLMLNLRQCEK